MKLSNLAALTSWYIVGTISVFWASLSCADAPSPRPDDPGAAVDSLLSEYAVEGSPGASVMVIRDGEVIHSRGYGSASLVDGTPLQPSTPVRLGSVTKAFTAMAIVILEENGAITFDSPVTNWVPELARFEGVTVRHLLNHTSGLPDYYDYRPLEQNATADGRETFLANAEAAAVYEAWGEPVFTPGDRFEYSNPGYEILGLIVERASGTTFGEFLDAQIFEPLGMSTAAVRDRPNTVIPGRAIGYSPLADDEGWRENDDHWGNWLVGAGGVYASLNDLYLWDQAMYAWADSGSRMTETLAAAALNDGTQSQYGFGWSLSDRLGRTAIHHSGGWVGFRTAIIRFPEERLTVIVLSNASANASELAETVAGYFLEAP